MSIQSIVVGLVSVCLGALFVLAGYRLFLILLPIWAFFAGFSIGASAVSEITGGGFLATATGWVAGIVIGLVLALLSYLFYVAAVGVLAATTGYWVGTGIVAWVGVGPGFVMALVGVLVAAVAVALTFALRVPKLLIIVLTALSGSSVLLTGVLLLFGRISLENLRDGDVAAVLRYSWFWGAAWLVIAIVGIVAQWMATPEFTLAHEAYRY
jgi:hypothetical protein